MFESEQNIRGEVQLWVRKALGLLTTLAVAIPSTYVEEVKHVADDAKNVSFLLAHNVKSFVNPQTPPDFESFSAKEAVDMTQEMFHVTDGLYADSLDGATWFATVWHHSRVLDMLHIAALTQDETDTHYTDLRDKAEDALEYYMDDNAGDFPPGYDPHYTVFGTTDTERFVDDNLWLAQHYMDRYTETREDTYINKSRIAVDVALHEQEADGGVFWKSQFADEQNQDRVVVSNATAIPPLVDIYLGGYANDEYIDSAERIYEWLQQLKDPKTGLYFDKFWSNGEIDETFHTYVQGKMIEATIALNKIDPARYPLSTAVELANASLDYFGRSGYGDAAFDSIYFQSVMSLASIVHDADLTRKVSNGIDSARGLAYRSNNVSRVAGAASLALLDEMELAEWFKLQ